MNHVIHPDDRERVWIEVEEGVKKHGHYQIYYRILTKEGVLRWVWEQGMGVFSPEEELLFLEGFITDITERKQAEESLRFNAERVQVLLNLNQMTEATRQHITDYALEEAVRLTQSKIGYLAFLNEDETVLTMSSGSRQAMQESAIIDLPVQFNVKDTGLWGEVVRQRRPVIINDYAAPNPLKKGYPAGHMAVKRHMNVPVFIGQHIVLVAGVGNKDSDYNEADAQQLTLLMEGMWRLIERMQAGEELQKYREHLEDLVAERTADLSAINQELEIFQLFCLT
ncbi:MAG: GAF domain-containing protein [Anaerolineaceae bacterium]